MTTVLSVVTVRHQPKKHLPKIPQRLAFDGCVRYEVDRSSISEPADALPIKIKLLTLVGCVLGVVTSYAAPPSFGGRYPHLAMSNSLGECGIGAVVPWAGKVWIVTYAPHARHGSDDRLFEIDQDLKLTARPESLGGTPAARFIHDPSRQLVIGPYVIDERGG